MRDTAMSRSGFLETVPDAHLLRSSRVAGDEHILNNAPYAPFSTERGERRRGEAVFLCYFGLGPDSTCALHYFCLACILIFQPQWRCPGGGSEAHNGREINNKKTKKNGKKKTVQHSFTKLTMRNTLATGPSFRVFMRVVLAERTS